MAFEHSGEGADALANELAKFARRPSIDGMPKMPVRSPIEQAPTQITGEIDIPWLMPYPSEYQGTIEPLALLTLAMCRDVDAIAAQGVKSTYGPDAKRFHYPDLWVGCNGPKIVEVKSFKDLMREKSIEKYAAIGKAMFDQGVNYRFLVDLELKVQPRAETVTLLSRYVNAQLDANSVTYARRALQAEKMTIRKLVDESNGKLSFADTYSLIAHRILAVDWNVALNLDAAISLPDQPFAGLRFNDLFTPSRHNDLLARLALGDKPTDQQRLEALSNRRRRKRATAPHEIVGRFPTRTLARPLRKSPAKHEIPDNNSTTDVGDEAPSNPKADQR